MGLCCWNPSILTLFKANCSKIATLFKDTKLWNWIVFFKFEDPINLYHAELRSSGHKKEWARHIPSEPNMDVSPLWARVSIRILPREPFSIYGGEETMHLKVKQQCISSRSVAYMITNFSGQFSKIYTSVLVNQSFHA